MMVVREIYFIIGSDKSLMLYRMELIHRDSARF